MFEKQTKEAYKPAKVKFFSIRPMNVLCGSNESTLRDYDYEDINEDDVDIN